MGRPKKHIYNSDETSFGGGDEEVDECKICHQEFTGLCPLNSARCPYIDKIEDAEEDEEEEESSDFDDVAKIDGVLADDKEAEKLIDESDAGPPPEGDFKDTGRYPTNE